MLSELNNIPNAKKFKEWFIFEAMSGYSKFKEPRAVSSVCMEFSADNGKVTKFIEVSSGGTVAGLKGTPTVSGAIKDLSGKVKIYAAWKSSGGNPYSSLRISNSYNPFDHNYDDTTLIGCIRKTIHEDKISHKFLTEEVEQLDEFRFISKTFDKIKGLGKDAVLWLKNLMGKIMKAIKGALNKIKNMGKEMFQAMFKFLGVSPEVKSTIPNEIKGFVNGMAN